MTYNLPKNSIVLVTGATGFTGTYLINKLLKQNLTIRVIARPSSRAEDLKKLGCEVFIGQVYDQAVINSACENVNYIFHVAAAFREAGISDDIYSKVHVDSTKFLAQAVAGKPDFKRFVHISTMGVHGHIKNPPGNEESPFAPGDLYQITKMEADIWIREFAKANNLSVTVVRPTGIYGPGDRRLLKIFKMSKWPIFPILGYGKCLYHLTHVHDLTNAFLLAAIHPAADQEVFLCGDAQAIPLVDMIKLSAEVTGKKPWVLRIPVTPFFILGDICEFICKPLKIEPPIYRRRVAFFTKDRSFDTSKIRNKLGFENEFTNETGIKSTVEWYLKEGWL